MYYHALVVGNASQIEKNNLCLNLKWQKEGVSWGSRNPSEIYTCKWIKREQGYFIEIDFLMWRNLLQQNLATTIEMC